MSALKEKTTYPHPPTFSSVIITLATVPKYWKLHKNLQHSKYPDKHYNHHKTEYFTFDM